MEGTGRVNCCCPSLVLSLSYLAPVFVLQMSLRATVTTIPTLATTHCLSVLLTLHPLTRSVHWEGGALWVTCTSQESLTVACAPQ